MRGQSNCLALVALFLLSTLLVLPARSERTSLLSSRIFGSSGQYWYFDDVIKVGNSLYVVGGKGPSEYYEYWHLWKIDPATLEVNAERAGTDTGDLVSVASDGNRLYAVGYLYYQSYYFPLLVAFDLQGNVIWSRKYADSESFAIGADVLLVGDYVYVLGYGFWSGSGYDVIFLKYDKQGNQLLSSRVGGDPYDIAYGLAYYQGRFYAAGTTRPSGIDNTKYDGCVFVLDEQGNLLNRFVWGGDKEDRFADIAVGSDLYVVGRTKSLGAGDFDALVLRMTPSGDVVWYRTYGQQWADRASSVFLDGDRIHVAGRISPSEGTTYPAYLVWRQNGTFVTAQAYSDGLHGEYSGFSGVIYEDGISYVVGSDIDSDYTVSRGMVFRYETTYDLTVSLPGPNYWSRVDDVNKTGASVSFSVSGATHTLEAAPQVVDGRTRYVFHRWSDQSTANPRSLKLTGDLWLGTTYSTEFLLDLQTSYGTAAGGGWIPAGRTTSIGLSPVTVDHGNGTRRIFAGWYADGTLLSGQPGVTFNMSRPLTVVAMWRTEHQVGVTSERGDVSGGGWKEAGTTATVSISPTVIEKDFFSNYVFEGWKDGTTVVSTQSTYSFTVTRPVTLVASWKTELNLITVGGLGGVALLVVVGVVFLVVRRPRPTPQSLPPPPPE